MDARPIQYRRTVGGVNITYWTLGEGKPVVWVNDSVVNHVEREWRSEWHRLWYEALAPNCKLVKFDSRGTGMSDRTDVNYALPARASDVDAVLDALGVVAQNPIRVV